jgi:hypothetical protein
MQEQECHTRTKVRFVSPYHGRNAPFSHNPPDELVWIGDIIQETYRKDKEDMFFDVDFMLFWIEVIQSTMESSCVKVSEDDRALENLTSWHQKCTALSDSDRNPPAHLYFMVQDQIFIEVVTEFWILSGGPMPYHDSYTYVFYGRQSEQSALLKIVAEKASKHGFFTELIGPQ